MEEYIYVNAETGKFARISDRLIEDTSLIQVPILPLDNNQIWNGTEWINISTDQIPSLKLPISLNESESLTPQQQTENGFLLLNNLNSLEVSNQIDQFDTSDVFYYKDAVPKVNQTGICTTKKGYLAFPQLKWKTEEENKTVSFIYFASNDNRYFLFGLAGDNFDWNNNNYNLLEIGIRVRSFRGVYGYYGQTEKNKYSYRSYTYQHGDLNCFFRCDITNNGAKNGKVRIYQLPDGKKENWLKGALIQEETLSLIPARKSNEVVPGVWDYLGSKNYLLGVIVS